MSLSMFRHKMAGQRKTMFKAALAQAGNELSQKLGFADPRKLTN